MRQWAIAIGINQYQHFQPLTGAQQDAQSLRDGWVQSGAIAADCCFLLTDTSPAIAGQPTQPHRRNIEALLEQLLQHIGPGDRLWCFFSGYGVCHQGQDYLMPLDGVPEAIESTGIAVAQVLYRLAFSPAASVLLLLDVNRSQSVLDQARFGMATAQAASDVGIATILSCQPSQFSQESSELGQGLFTTALLEGLRGRNYRTLAELHRFLRDRLPQLGDHHRRPIQNPFTICPPDRIHQVILPLPVPALSAAAAPASARLLLGERFGGEAEPGAPNRGTQNREFWRGLWRWGSLALTAVLVGMMVQTCSPPFRKRPVPASQGQRSQAI
jgi:uncharacterized caspase-like protein